MWFRKNNWKNEKRCRYIFNVRGLAAYSTEPLELLGQDLQKCNIDIARIQDTYSVGPGQQIINKLGKTNISFIFYDRNPTME